MTGEPHIAGTPALALTGIAKRFGSVQALHGADFMLMPGQLHALLGENGAGKSTLMAVAYGMHAPDEGTVECAGVRQRFTSPLDARAAGIGMVHQHSTAIDAMTVAENVALAAGWPMRRPRALHARVRALSEQTGLPLEPAARVAELTVALKQRLEIVKALAGDARILLLDEPAAVLAPPETAELLRLVRQFCRNGGSAVLITHKLDEALEHADAITVLRRGRVVLTGSAATLTRDVVATAMIGTGEEGASAAVGPERHAVVEPSASVRSGPPVLQLRAVEAHSLASAEVPAVRGVTLEVQAGEIVGVIAVEGNGQRELLRVAAGLHAHLRGTVQRAERVAFVPEDRTVDALIGRFTLTENVVLGAPMAALAGVREASDWRLRTRLDWRAAREATARLMTRFDVRAPHGGVAAQTLSGGNQQKLVLGRALARQPALLVVENPTRGLDFAATAFVHRQLRAAAADGAGILLHASDLDEVLALATRVVVMHGGRLGAVPAGADRAMVGELMLAPIA